MRLHDSRRAGSAGATLHYGPADVTRRVIDTRFEPSFRLS
jgi:hypothetical protein